MDSIRLQPKEPIAPREIMRNDVTISVLSAMPGDRLVLGFDVHSDNYFPITSVPVGRTPLVADACQLSLECDILITPAVYPVVPNDRSVLRFPITASNTDGEIDRALKGLARVRQLVESANPTSTFPFSRGEQPQCN